MSNPLGSGSQLPWDGIPAYIRGPQSTILENNPFIGSNLMRVILIGVDNSWWDLAGAYAGRQYLTLSNHASGFMFPPFKTLFTEGPYQVGAYPERTDFLKRTMNLGIDVGIDYLGGPSSMQYRMLEQRFWRALSPTEDAWLLCFTKTHGWRILKIRLAEEPKTPMEFDPTTYENNYMRWDIVVVACNPYYAKRTVLDSWVNPEATATPWDEIQYQIQNTINKFLGDVLAGGGGTLVPGKDVGSGHVTAWNNSDYTQWPKFLVSSPGRCWIEDGPGTGRMIPMPLTTPDRGTFMVDTDPNAQTISEENDPVDPWFYQIARNSQFLDVVLGNLTTQTEPLWKQFNGRFQIPAPKRSRCTYKVYHSENGGTVQLLMPQAFNMAYG
jgi:hypothetical protein